jgi:hypothetical protein
MSEENRVVSVLMSGLILFTLFKWGHLGMSSFQPYHLRLAQRLIMPSSVYTKGDNLDNHRSN